MGAVFFDAVTPSRLLIVLLLLLGVQVLRSPRLFFCRESVLYLAFVAYMFLTLLWTPDPVLAMNTLFPAVDFFLVQMVLGSLARFGRTRAMLFGTLVGFWIGAGIFTYVQGFPFVSGRDLSYNGIAAMYLFGLYVTLVLGCVTRSKVLLLVAALIALAHIVATTSIKTNLGVLVGAVGASIVFFGESIRVLRRNVLALIAGVGVIAYVVGSSTLAIEGLQRGLERVALGVSVLQAREDRYGYEGFGERAYWMHEGLQAWVRNPLFGNGVEAFRSEYGITSHSTPIDLLYNTGLIGFSLFYAMFVALAWRLLDSRSPRSLRALVLAGLICNFFIALSGTLFYQTFLAGFFATSAAVLQNRGETDRSA